ncbi:PD40 domain-containing protein [candidate division KSB1 bacterium]|nr:PD40 domain-containing protein [candidate division KSB1 bacterium]
MKITSLSRRCWSPLIFAFLLIAAPRLQAQYFGQNKVQYENFKFEILKTTHFDIYFYPEEKEAAEHAARLAERWYARLAFILQHELNGRQPLILYASHPHFQQTNTISGGIGEGTGGVTEALKRRIVLPFAGPIAETDHVIGHELVHAFQYDITGVNSGSGFRSPAGLQLPLWFMEGMAELLSIGSVDPHTAMWMRDAAKADKLPKISQLEDPRYFPYRYGQALLAYVAGRWGDGVIGDLLKQSTKGGNLALAIRHVLGVSPDTLSMEWHQAVREAYKPLQTTTDTPDKYGRQIISKKQNAGELNVGPVLSPDGKLMIFFSEKNLFSINLFLADAETGKIKRNLVRAEMDPHYESLGFISSAGAWDFKSERVAFGLITKGRPGLSVLDVRSNKVVREFRFPQLGEIFNPTWSPDGRFIAFSALVQGMTDLFIFDLKADSLRRVTRDFYSDLHPAWSPDGKHIAFATDRFSTTLDNLNIGNYRLALYEVASGQISPVPGFAAGKHLNPQWSPDAASIYFLSDRTGITNIYRVELASNKLLQITNLYTGVSGITATSPALSVAAKTNRMSFSVYENGDYNIYSIDSPEVLAGKPVTTEMADFNAAALPPFKRVSTTLDSTIKNISLGLPGEKPDEVLPYKSKLALTYVSQPFLAAGYDSYYGAQVGGGISFFWSDMLGNHNLVLVTQAQIDGSFNDFAAQLGYFNSTRRWNWGASIQQIPYISSQFLAGSGTIDGSPVYVEQELRYRQLNREIVGLLAYPFNRAQRMEFSAGLQNISFDLQQRTRVYSYTTGQMLSDQKVDLPAPGGLNLTSGSLALVYDTSIFGATSPIIGQSYRLEFSPILGTVKFNNVLLDYRRYLMPLRPFTFATRIFHYGRYGQDSETDRLTPLFLGYPGLVRGYDSNSFSQSECSGNDCPTFDRLIGSKIALANFEMRFPLLGLLHAGPGYYGFLPLETAVFYDLGVAWTKAEEAAFLGGSREFVRSYGATARLNLLGYLVLQLDYVNPIDRPQKGWYWQFNFTTGF